MSIRRRILPLSAVVSLVAMGGAGAAFADPGHAAHGHHTAAATAAITSAAKPTTAASSTSKPAVTGDAASSTSKPAVTGDAGGSVVAGRDANSNNIYYWQIKLTREGYTGVSCEKLEPQNMTRWTVDKNYALIVVNAANQNLEYRSPAIGDKLDSTRNHRGNLQGISHVIQCVGVAPQKPAPSTSAPQSSAPATQSPEPVVTPPHGSAPSTTHTPGPSTPAPEDKKPSDKPAHKPSERPAPKPAPETSTPAPEVMPTATAPAVQSPAPAIQQPAPLAQTGSNVLLGGALALTLIGAGVGVVALSRRRR